MKTADKSARWKTWLLFLSLWVLTFFLVTFFSGSFNPQHAAITPHDSTDSFAAHMDKHIPALMQQYQIPGCSIALVKNGQIADLKAYGYADLESGRQLTIDTPMSVQSISKSVTAWGVMKLVEQDKLDLDTPVAQYLKSWEFPESLYPASSITIRQLLTHTAGLPLGNVADIYSPGEPMPSLREKMSGEALPLRNPGTGFSYSNTGYNLLELLIEEVSGRKFSEYMHTEVLQPLNMNSSSFDWNDNMNPRPPTGYDLNGKAVPPYVYPVKASGGLSATAEDIVRFAAAGMMDSNPVLKTSSLESMYQPAVNKIGFYGLVFDGYGLGHFIETWPDGKYYIAHGGQGKGIMTHFQAVPATGDAIVILTNSQRTWPFIAHVLKDWAKWAGFSSIGMEKIIGAQYGLIAIISLLLSISILLLIPLFTSFNNLPVNISISKLGIMRGLKIITALSLIGILLWASAQEYLFLASIFPTLYLGLGITLLILALALLLSALLPRPTIIRK